MDPVWEWLGYLRLRSFSHLSENEIKKRVKKSIFYEIHELLKSTGQNTPPYDPKLIAPYRKIKEIIEVPLHRDGMLIPTKGGFILKVNKTLYPNRLRFSYAHEIGHTFFYDLKTEKPYRPQSSFKNSRWDPEEGLCHNIAREILIPESDIKQRINVGSTPSAATLRILANEFQVSLEALIRKIQELDLWDATIIIWDYNKKKILRIDDVFKIGSHKKFGPIKTKKPFKINSDLKSSLQTALNLGVGLSLEELSIGSLKGNFMVSSLRMYNNSFKIVSVIYLLY